MIDDFSMKTREHTECMLLTKMTLKCIKVIQKEINLSNEEIHELINYFVKIEQYNICNKLKNELK